ncbi:Putative uncharacterized transposon-derived protein, partial [Frankliniella fusca]
RRLSQEDGQNGNLDRIYYDTRHPAGFSTPARLKKASNLSQDTVNDYLDGQRAYTLHKNVRKNFPRNKTYADTIDACWQCDLMDCSSIADHNQSQRFIFVVIDVFSKYAWTVPIPDKKAATIVYALQTLFDMTTRRCAVLLSDKGREINNTTVKKFLKEHGIEYFHTQNPQTKCSVAERFIRTLRMWMQRYFTRTGQYNYTDGVLADITHAYNHKTHRSIKMTPAEASDENNIMQYNTLYGDLRREPVKPRLKVGDHVRISREKQMFEKGTHFNWTEEIFKIVKIIPHQQPVYKIADIDHNEEIEGHFYSWELNKVKKPTAFQIDHVVDTKGKGPKKQLLVHWQGYPVSSRSWIFEKDIL